MFVEVRSFRRRGRSDRGGRGLAALELAISLPVVILPLLLGLWELGRMVEVQQILSAAAREGGRQASTGLLTNTQVQAVVTQYLQNASIPTTHVTVTVTNLTNTGVDASAATQLDGLQIVATIPYNDVRWVNMGLVTTPTTQLSGSATWLSGRDKDYPAPSYPAID